MLDKLLSMELPETTILKVSDRQGAVVLEEETVVLDMLAGQARKDLDIATPTGQLDWVKEFSRILNSRYGTDLSTSQGMAVLSQIGRIMEELKKSPDSLPSSLGSTPAS